MSPTAITPSLTCIMLDDEPLALDILRSYAEQLAQLRPRGYFTTPHLAYDTLVKERVDLVFLDIKMPDINGLRFLANLPYRPMVIFSTAFEEYAVKGFELDAIDYLVKPYELERFRRAVIKAYDYHRYRQQDRLASDQFLFVRSTYTLIKVDLTDLYLVETDGDYLKLHLHSRRRPLHTLMTLRQMEQLLPNPAFLRVHRSFIVATNQIQQVRAKKMVVKGVPVPIGSTYLAAVRQLIG
ncbi:MAG: LytTR family DNA-binding domain-containing protein [Bacteroidota bacterium]